MDKTQDAAADSSILATKICTQIQSIFSSPSPHPPPLPLLLSALTSLPSPTSKIFLYGVGREGLILRGLTMRLSHLNLASHFVGDVTTPPISSSDLLLISAGPGGFATVDALARVAKAAGARVVLVTARPEGSTAVRLADDVVCLPARTMADEKEEEGEGLVMGSLYEGGMFVLFEMLVIRLMEKLGQSEEKMRARHTNLE